MNKKQIFIDRVKKQTNIELKEENFFLTEKRNILYTEVKSADKIRLLSFLDKHNIRHEEHIGNFYFIWV